MDEIKTIFQYCNFEFNCNFENLFQICNNKDLQRPHEITDEVIYLIIKWLEYILLTILRPVFGLIGLTNNTLILITIRNKEKQKLFKDQMYKFVQINALSNIFYCILISFSLLNTCLCNHANSLFCSPFFKTLWAQYFTVIGQTFLGNVFRTSIYVSYLFFSVSRLIDVGNLKEKKFFAKIQKLNLKLFSFILILFSILLSFFKLFQYKIVWNQDSMISEYPLENVNQFDCACKGCFKDNLEYLAACKSFDTLKPVNDIFYFINTIFNDILFFILSLVLDIYLLKYFNQSIEHKILVRNRDGTLSLFYDKE